MKGGFIVPTYSFFLPPAHFFASALCKPMPQARPPLRKLLDCYVQWRIALVSAHFKRSLDKKIVAIVGWSQGWRLQFCLDMLAQQVQFPGTGTGSASSLREISKNEKTYRYTIATITAPADIPQKNHFPPFCRSLHVFFCGKGVKIQRRKTNTPQTK